MFSEFKKRLFSSQSLTEDVARQTEREKQLQHRYAELVEELKELSREGNVEAVYENGKSVEVEAEPEAAEVEN